jgi:hypothetical protein
MLRAAGLSLEVGIAGGPRPAWLSALERPGVGDIGLQIELIPGPIRDGQPLRARRDGGAILVSGDGLNGVLRESSGELRVQGGDEALRAALRLACAAFGVDRGLLLLHAACAIEQGRARAFAGPSGAGKTTLARLVLRHVPGATILSDEVTAVDARGRVHGHPFASALGDGIAPDEGAPLRSLSLLEHGPRTRAEPLSPTETARALLPRIFLPLRDARSLRAALGAVERVVARVPARRLWFVPDATAVAA